jgi:hypothetical protein
MRDPAETLWIKEEATSLRYVYEDIPPANFPEGKALARIKLTVFPPPGAEGFTPRCKMRLTLSDPAGGWSAVQEIARVEDERVYIREFKLPPLAPSRRKGYWLSLTLEPLEKDFTIGAGPDGVALISPVGGYSVNLAKSLLLVWLKIAVVAAVAVLGATFLSWPVAVLFACFVALCGFLSGYLLETADQLARPPVAGFDAFVARLGKIGSNTPEDEIEQLFANARQFGIPESIVREVRARGSVTPEVRALVARLLPPRHEVIMKRVILGFCRILPHLSHPLYSGTERLADRIDIPWRHVGGAAWAYGVYALAALGVGVLFFQWAEVE